MENKIDDMLARKRTDIRQQQKKSVLVHKINYEIRTAIDKELMESIYTKNKKKINELI